MNTRTHEELEEIARKMQEATTRLELNPAEACTALYLAITSELKTISDRQLRVRVARGVHEIMVQELLR